MISNDSKTIRLYSATDWDSWNRRFESDAQDRDVLDKIRDPVTHPWLTRPSPPSLGRFVRRRPATQADLVNPLVGSSRNLRSQTAEVETQAADPNALDPTGAPATVIDDLTPHKLGLYNSLQRLYELSKRDYEKEQDHARELRKWIKDTVAIQFTDHCCIPGESLDQWHKKLKEEVGADDISELRRARERYKAATAILTRVPKDLMEWLNTWESALSHATLKKVPEAQQATTWFDDLEAALKVTPLKQYLQTYRVYHRAAIIANTLSYREVRANLSEEIIKEQRVPATRARLQRGAFEAHRLDDDDQGEGARASGSTGKRKRDDGDDEPRCLACNIRRHKIDKCYYVSPERAGKWFKPNPRIQEEVNKRLEEDSELIKEVEKLKKRRKTPAKSRISTPMTKSESTPVLASTVEED
ncbi:hypothetical protein B0T21DRAFT_112790 [Apiosordaria backusii]|uniref:Gag protein n=1 Tax=Apiosordaria backusii TaxID=314023 RepID=A0AA40DID9_9PEZI|nr:hypothetical protein B0T21DRAFT_112790 [Apiosordaria backusii]